MVVAGGGAGTPGPTGGTRHQEPLWRWQGGAQGGGGASLCRLKQTGSILARSSSTDIGAWHYRLTVSGWQGYRCIEL